MATIDYKEKYEQALERAKYYHDRDNIQFLENIFPELKESEDEKTKKEIINYLECQSRDEPSRKDTINKWIDWLKDRVLPQSQWKPSGEQIMAIDTAINVLGKGTLNGKQLIELYQDLKKLKGEEI